MGSITSLIKKSSSGINNQLKQANINIDIGKLQDINIKIPQIPNDLKDINPDFSKLKVPSGVISNVTSLASSAIDSVNSILPSEISGITLPKIPKLPDFISKASSIKDLLSENTPDLSNFGLEQIKTGFKVSDFVESVNLNNFGGGIGKLPDFSNEMSKFNTDNIESEINSIGRGIPGFEDFDITGSV